MALNVLLAEDNPVAQRVVKLMLEREGCQVTTVSDGAEAVREATTGTRHYQLIIMDLQMPNLDGFEATAKIRQEELRQHRAPQFIVALSLNDLDAPCSRSLAAGMNAFLSKPILAEKLKLVLDEVDTSSQSFSCEASGTQDETTLGLGGNFVPLFEYGRGDHDGAGLHRLAGLSETRGLEDVLVLSPGRPLVFEREKAMALFRSEALMLETLEEFFIQAEAKLKLLLLAVKNEDIAEIRETVHWFRGGASFLFSPIVLEACIELTQVSLAKPMPGLIEATDALGAALSKLQKHIPKT